MALQGYNFTHCIPHFLYFSVCYFQLLMISDPGFNNTYSMKIIKKDYLDLFSELCCCSQILYIFRDSAIFCDSLCFSLNIFREYSA